MHKLHFLFVVVQIAMQYQAKDMIAEAEKIYRNILSEYPSHPDALHLLGVIFYQKGDPVTAIPYIERALMGNKTDEAFHNSLGECYRISGRTEDAKKHFELALRINPQYISAVYNLGLTLQEQNDWDTAISMYQR